MREKTNAAEGRKIVCRILEGICLVGILASGCGREVPGETAASAPTTQPIQLPEPVVAESGDPASVLCKASYTASEEALEATRQDTVARMEGSTLTAGQLRVRYALAVSAYRQSGKEPAPDFAQSLDTQLCPLEDGLSWQHYFLKAALTQWHAQQALLAESRKTQTVSSEYYEPRADLHEQNMTEDLPAKKYLYETKDGYTPNSMHQGWLDSLPETLAGIGLEKGYDSLSGLAAGLTGGGADEKDLCTVAWEINFSYMYYTQRAYDFDVAAEALSGTEERDAVDIRHCLLIPENDGEDGWEKCRWEAEELLKKWENNWLTARSREGNFARMVNENSDDEASRPSGGLYTGIRPGQLIAPLDAWCFDAARQPGDAAVLRSDIGYHIVFFRGGTRYTEEGSRRFRAAGTELVEALTEEYPMTADYSAVSLGTPESAAALAPEEFLYPDVAHERFPEPILFLQQDYPRAPYGYGYFIERHGCGITTMAMLASYMTDRLYTPDALAKKYAIYSVEEGTDGNIFMYVPQEFGFFPEKAGYSWEDARQALEKGAMVVTLQGEGYFTTVGHFMLLAGIKEDGTVVVRDPNIKAYGKLEENKTGSFPPSRIYNANQVYYIMQNKVTSYPECCRCGSGEGSKILTDDYLCEKCTQALLRRNGFLSMCAGGQEGN